MNEVEQLREKIQERLYKAAQFHLPIQGEVYEFPGTTKLTNQIISALADTLKIVGEEVIGKNFDSHLEIDNSAVAYSNRLRDEQRQRLELVVGEMKR